MQPEPEEEDELSPFTGVLTPELAAETGGNFPQLSLTRTLSLSDTDSLSLSLSLSLSFSLPPPLPPSLSLSLSVANSLTARSVVHHPRGAAALDRVAC